MSSADWTLLSDVLDPATIDRGVTTGIARPNGGGSFIFGFNSLAVTAGGVAYTANQASFAPMAQGGSIRGAVQRGISGGPKNFAPFFYLSSGGASLNDNAYMLGLQDDDPHRIVLRKGRMADGLPAGSPGTVGILRRSTATFTPGTWLHLRLDVVVNANGDVILKCFQNDLGANAVSAPVWVAIPGMDDFVDDVLAVNSGSAPYVGGHAGFGFTSGDVTRRGYFDQLEVIRQL